MNAHPAVLPDRPWAICGALAGFCGIVSYGMLIVLDTSPPVAALLLSLFSVGFMTTGIGFYLGVTRAVSPRLGLLSAVANVAAGGELLAMGLVQMAVRNAAPHPGSAMTGVWLGLDVAWDVFGGAGTLLLGFALWSHRRFRPVLALTGILVSILLLAFNIATFPTPPAEAGWVDVGPLVALWYLALCVQVLLVARGQGAVAGPAVASAAAGADEVLAGMATGEGDG